MSRFGNRVALQSAMVVAAITTGCGLVSSKHSGPEAAPIAEWMSDLNPSSSPGKKAVLELAGTKVPVDIQTQRQGSDFVVELDHDGDTLEREVYKVEPRTFSVKSVAGDVFNPPIPILKFPLRSDQTWRWDGNTSIGLEPTRASAEITPSIKHDYLSGVPVDVVRIEVQLSLYEDPGRTPVQRELNFYFAQNHGLFRRDDGNASIRQPPN